VQSASFGGGMIRMGSVDVSVTIDNAGAPSQQVIVNVGSAAVGGVPVTINHQGVAVASALVPGLGLATDQADAALNQALAQSGYQVRTVAPKITRSANQESIDATGAEVTYQQPATAPGVPRQQAIHDLGEVFADNLAVPGTPPGAATAVTSPLPTTSGGQATGPSSVFVPGTPGTPAVPGTPGVSGTSAGTPAAVASPLTSGRLVVRRSKPIDLVLLYFMWQSLLLGTVASLWWRRAELARVAP
jgi:hypothetical protein